MRGKATRHEVLLTRGAERDLESIDDYIAEFDSVENARHVLDELEKVLVCLAHFTERGGHPK
jgi:toxin ParE1/3/4